MSLFLVSLASAECTRSPATMSEKSKETFGKTTPIGRPGQPVEIATCFVFLASADSGYMSGQTLHPNGGVVIS